MPSQPKLDPSPSQLPIASVLACRLVLLHKTHAGISVASPDPCRHQSYLTRPTSASVLLHQTHAADQSACSPIVWVPSDFLFCLVWVEEKNWRFGFFFFFFFFFFAYCVLLLVVLLLVVVVVGVADGRGGCGRFYVFFFSGIYYFIVVVILFYCIES